MAGSERANPPPFPEGPPPGIQLLAEVKALNHNVCQLGARLDILNELLDEALALPSLVDLFANMRAPRRRRRT